MVIGSTHDIPEAVFELIASEIGRPDPDRVEIVGGGSINRSYRLTTLDGTDLMLKTNDKSGLDMFAAEREGLLAIRAAESIRVPEPLLVSVGGDKSFLVLEYIEMGQKTPAANEACGIALADMHRRHKPQYGWHRDNTIGSTPQVNRWSENWIEFFRDARLGYQFRLAADNGLGDALLKVGERLLELLPEFFTDHEPAASLLHGDLWGGNWGATFGEVPVIFDPAVYFGDREADVAMTRLFGGFGTQFYAAYNEAYPLDPGFERRCGLYNLYHVLNHFNLFGGGYRNQVAELLRNLL